MRQRQAGKGGSVQHSTVVSARTSAQRTPPAFSAASPKPMPGDSADNHLKPPSRQLDDHADFAAQHETQRVGRVALEHDHGAGLKLTALDARFELQQIGSRNASAKTTLGEGRDARDDAPDAVLLEQPPLAPFEA